MCMLVCMSVCVLASVFVYSLPMTLCKDSPIPFGKCDFLCRNGYIRKTISSPNPHAVYCLGTIDSLHSFQIPIPNVFFVHQILKVHRGLTNSGSDKNVFLPVGENMLVHKNHTNLYTCILICFF